MYMSLRPYYTINASLLIEQNIHCIDHVNTKLNILLNTETEFTPHLYRILASLKNEYIVSLAASLFQDQNILSDLSAKLYLLVVLNNSSKGQKVLPIFSKAGQANSLHIGKVQTYLNQQGLYDVKLPVFKYSVTGIQTIDNCALLVMSGQPADLRNEYSGDNAYATTMIIASREEITDLTAIADLRKQMVSYQGNSNLNDDIYQFYIEKEEFEVERELWRKRTLLYQDFLSLSKRVQEKEYFDVLNWYKKEYEILPTWYKRVGHVIKVMMGKRSFKSLFDDRLKDKE